MPVVNEKGDDDHVLIMDVASSERQVVRRRKDGKVALRKGDESVWLDHEQIRALEYDKGEYFFESEVLRDSSMNDVDAKLWRPIAMRLEPRDDERLLRSLGRAQGRASHQRRHDAVRRERTGGFAASQIQGNQDRRHRNGARRQTAHREGPDV